MKEIGNKEVLSQKPLVIGMVGCLASGKTTLSKELGRRWGINPIEEAYPANPFLEKFYEDPPEYSLKSQVFFLTSKIEQLEKIKNVEASLIDPSLTMDYLYAKTHYKMGWMNHNEWNLYQNLFYALSGKDNLPYPDMHIVVVADQKDLEKRIVERDRPYEMWILKKYPQYLKNLSESVDEWVKESRGENYTFIANTSAEGQSSDVEGLANRIESHIQVRFALKGNYVLPKIKPPLNSRGEDSFPGKDGDSLRFIR